MTNFTRQPDVLPAVLPAGTRLLNGWEFVDTATLIAPDVYGGKHTERDGGPVSYSERVCNAYHVDWTSVEAPPETEAPKLCAACGAHGAYTVRGDGIGLFVDHAAELLCKGCWGRNARETMQAIRARRQLTATPDRPIQAGDWVECVNAYSDGGLGLLFGHRYEVRSVAGDKSGYLELDGVRHPLIGWASERFKRVDGPHPECPPEFAEPRFATHIAGEWIVSQPTCSKCKSPAVRLGMCVYCHDRTQHLGESVRHLTDKREANIAARQRLAAIERKERPRVTATSRMLAAGHPVGWPSNEGED